MARYATGKKSWGISDRSGFRYRLSEMRKEWTGLLVGKDEWEEKHPQLHPLRVKPDAQALKNARPEKPDDNIKFLVYTNVGKGILGKELTSFEATASVGSVTVTT